MKEASIIYPHQLFADNPSLKIDRTIYLVEEPLFLREFPIHNQKLLLHRLSMKAYQARLRQAGFEVIYLEINSLKDSETVFEALKKDGVDHVHIVDTTDFWLEKRIVRSALKFNLHLTRYESPLFILDKNEAIDIYKKSGKHMARFYKKIRIENNILIDSNKGPEGGRWSFDEDNRKKIPKNTPLPDDPKFYKDESEIIEAKQWLNTVQTDKYGEERVWLPWTHADAEIYLDEFISNRLSLFGDYEDAIISKNVRLFHSGLSALINIGLISPKQVIQKIISTGKTNKIKINCIEGFIRQIIGWREFIRASYECDGIAMRTKNFWKNQNPLPNSFWDGTTGIFPLDNVIEKALTFGYNHHIERLMVLGNFMLLTKTHPDDVYKWFMAMYVDAYDWVMVPNVYGMSQFADGGIFATKPYISGSSYLKKMSNYPTGDWEDLWTALYWNFIDEHRVFFSSNHRLSMMPKLFDKMSTEKRNYYYEIAKNFLQNKDKKQNS